MSRMNGSAEIDNSQHRTVSQFFHAVEVGAPSPLVHQADLESFSSGKHKPSLLGAREGELNQAPIVALFNKFGLLNINSKSCG